jgi:release factor glutamine methyltransferase
METTFHGLQFRTEPGRVFTPRPATEELVDAALRHIDGKPLTIADVGTGAGVIGITLAVEAPQIVVYATDINPDAVTLARENAERLGVADRVHVLQGDLLEPLPEPVDIVVANLPYIPEGDPRPEYADEPPSAVYAPGDGLELLRRLIDVCELEKLKMPGWVLVQYDRRVLECDSASTSRPSVSAWPTRPPPRNLHI